MHTGFWVHRINTALTNQFSQAVHFVQGSDLSVVRAGIHLFDEFGAGNPLSAGQRVTKPAS